MFTTAQVFEPPFFSRAVPSTVPGVPTLKLRKRKEKIFISRTFVLGLSAAIAFLKFYPKEN